MPLIALGRIKQSSPVVAFSLELAVALSESLRKKRPCVRPLQPTNENDNSRMQLRDLFSSPGEEVPRIYLARIVAVSYTHLTLPTILLV